MIQIFAGLLAEGTTDVRFLKPIVEKTLIKVAFTCKGQIEIELLLLDKDKSLNFIQEVLQASKKGVETFGMTILCVHTDADATNSENVYQYKINPAQIELAKQSDTYYCKNLVAIVPIQETESWMLADKELLKSEIGTAKTDTELNIHRQPESVANPKEIIEQAILIARSEVTKRRRNHLSIFDLYQPIGQSMDLEKLATLSSYQDFQENIREAFRKMNLL
jgi:Domain of unknown function (DUF4276)